MAMQLGEATIGQGSTGEEVKKIQQVLQSQGYNVGPVDGIYGPQTQSAIQAFQKTKNLLPDGIVGPLTWSALQGAPVATASLPVVTVQPAPASFLSSMFSPTSILLGVGGVLLFSMMGKSKGKRRR